MVFVFVTLVFGNLITVLYLFLWGSPYAKDWFWEFGGLLIFGNSCGQGPGNCFELESFGWGYDWETIDSFDRQHWREYRRRKRTPEQSGLQTLFVYGSRIALRNKTPASPRIQTKIAISRTNQNINAAHRRINPKIKRSDGQNRNIQKNWKI